ncbi:unnamed protein product, partial [Ixodes pacificus]
MEFEDVIEKAGGYGKFQKILVWVYLAPASVFMPGYFMNQIFMLSVPQHSCLLPDLGEVFNLTGGDPELLHDLLVSKDNCEVYPLSAFNASAVQTYLDHAGDENWTRLEVPGLERIPCTQFTYDKTNYESTASTQWNLVCDRAYLPSLVFTLCSVSCAVGTVLLGMLSDRIGRRYMFFITVVVAVLSGLSSVLVTNFTAFATLRALNASVMPQMFQLPYIILLELVGPKQRTMMLGVSCIAWTVGLCILPLLAYVCRSWILLGLICSACAIPNMFYLKLIPESPRWLLSQGRVKETRKILERIAKRNGAELPEGLESDLLKVQHKLAEEKVVAESSSADLLRKPRIRRHILIVTASWVANNCAYYGLHINVSNMSGNEFLNFFLLGLVEFPASFAAWWTMEHYGRRWTNVSYQLLVSMACVASCFIPSGAIVSGVTASLIAKFACTASFMIMYQQAAELMPTPLRAFALGSSSAFSSGFCICMPYIIYLVSKSLLTASFFFSLLASV